MLVDRRDGGYGVAVVEGLRARQNVVTQKSPVYRGLANLLDLVFSKWEILRRHDRSDTGQGLRLARVYRLDTRMGMGTPQQLANQRSWWVQVRSILGQARDLVRPIVADRPSAYNLVFSV